MKLTKYEHSCLDVELDGQRLLIDPGKFSTTLNDLTNVAVVVVTHVHSDHFDPERLKLIRNKNPSLKIYAPQQVVDEDSSLKLEAVKSGQTISVGAFKLEFFGGKHELYEGFENVGVFVNDTLYHPGDSYAMPNKPIKLLAAPASAPWLRVTEATQFIKDCSATAVFPIHNALLSEIGESIHYRILSEAAEASGSQWKPLRTGQSLTL